MAAPVFKPLSMASGCLTSLSTLPVAKNPHSLLFPRKYAIKSSRIACFPLLLPLRSSRRRPTRFFVAKTSDWARQDEDSEVGLSDWEGEAPFGEEGDAEEDDVFADEGEVVAEGEFEGGEEFADEAVDSYPEPPEEAKLFVGNLPYDIDSEKLAHMFEEAGVVEVAEVIYNRETDQSRGFGFVTMSTVEEAEKAVDKFHRYDLNGRLLTVNKAAPRGSRPEKTAREFEPSFRVYVGNLPWQVDDSRLEQVFSEYGKVVDARVVYDRETGRSRGFGFVTMSNKVELDNVIAAFDGQTFEGRTIRVNVAEERPTRRPSF